MNGTFTTIYEQNIFGWLFRTIFEPSNIFANFLIRGRGYAPVLERTVVTKSSVLRIAPHAGKCLNDHPTRNFATLGPL